VQIKTGVIRQTLFQLVAQGRVRLDKTDMAGGGGQITVDLPPCPRADVQDRSCDGVAGKGGDIPRNLIVYL